MRVKGATIPSSFQLIDTHVTDEDQVVSARDQDIIRKNHNILAAQRVRRDIIQGTDFNNNTVSRFPVFTAQSRLYRFALALTPLQKQLRFWCWAALTYEDSPDTDLVIAVHEPQVNAYTSVAITVSGATSAEYGADIVVPPRAGEATDQDGFWPYICDIYVDSTISTSKTLTAVAIVDVGHNWVACAAASSPTNAQALVINNDVRKVVDVVPVGANVKAFVDEPWSVTPIPGTDTFDSHLLTGVDVKSYGIYELPIAAFTDEFGETGSAP